MPTLNRLIVGRLRLNRSKCLPENKTIVRVEIFGKKRNVMWQLLRNKYSFNHLLPFLTIKCHLDFPRKKFANDATDRLSVHKTCNAVYCTTCLNWSYVHCTHVRIAMRDIHFVLSKEPIVANVNVQNTLIFRESCGLFHVSVVLIALNDTSDLETLLRAVDRDQRKTSRKG